MAVPARFYFALILFFSSPALGQDLTGTWEGRGGGAYARLCIAKQGDVYVGYTYDEGMGYCKCNFLGTFDSVSKKLKGVNKGVIEKTFFHSQSRYNLKYSESNGTERLDGIAQVKSPATLLLSFGLPTFIYYTRISRNIDTTAYMLARLSDNRKENLADSFIIAKEDTLNFAAPHLMIDSIAFQSSLRDSIIAASENRPADTLSVITVSEKKLSIKVVDNGIVDGDTVSIIRNGKVIAERIAVSTIPYEINITAENDNEVNELILVAHNTGSITPNTALILIETPSRQYRLTASTDLNKNAMIIFRYKE